MSDRQVRRSTCCSPGGPRAIDADEAVQLKALFRMLANDTRLRILHLLVRFGETCVTDMAKCLGLKPQAVSNQLQRLNDAGIVAYQRDGNNVYYRVANLCVTALLELALCLTGSGSCVGAEHRQALLEHFQNLMRQEQGE